MPRSTRWLSCPITVADKEHVTTDIDEDEDACPRCHGEGTIPCETCRGRGGRNVNRLGPSSFDYREGTEGLQWETCTTCDGNRREVCPECFGGDLE